MLSSIVAAKRKEVASHKRNKPLSELLKAVIPGNFAFSQTIAGQSWSLIAECKLASPAKGALTDKRVGELAGIYEGAGAAALSVLTDRHFGGCMEHISEARKSSRLPVLRKDFILDEYQLCQARALGADASLLIAAILTDKELKQYLAVAEEIGLDCLVEVHSREELKRVQQTSARMIGINNRDLQTFTTSIEQTFALLPYCESNRLLISESGIKSQRDAVRLQAAGLRGALVGEGLVTAADIPGKVRELS